MTAGGTDAGGQNPSDGLPSTNWRQAKAHVVVDDLGSPYLSDGDAHHLGRVLRLRVGDLVSVTDGRGGCRAARFLGIAGGQPHLDLAGSVAVVEPRLEPALRVGFALTKGDKPELVVQKLTEFGVDEIVAFAADRSVVLWDDAKVARALARWRSVAREALQQSRQLWLPTVSWSESLDALVGRVAEAGGRVVRADADGSPLAQEEGQLVVVGPEGGWSDRERSLVAASTRFGPSVLRAETASLTAGALLTALRSGAIQGPEFA